MFGNLGFWEIMIFGLVVLLVFGARRLPEIGQSLGKGIREFKKSFSDTTEAVTGGAQDDRLPPARQLDSAPPPQSSEPKRLSQ